jgi:hypothetical protein
MRINLSGASDSGFSAVPAGTYICKITGGEATVTGPNSKKPGSPMVKWEFTVQEGEYQGRKFFMNNVLVPDSDGVERGLGRLREVLLASGRFEESDLMGEVEFEFDDLIGCDVKVKVKVRPASGDYDESNDVQRVRRVTDEDLADMSMLP